MTTKAAPLAASNPVAEAKTYAAQVASSLGFTGVLTAGLYTKDKKPLTKEQINSAILQAVASKVKPKKKTVAATIPTDEQLDNLAIAGGTQQLRNSIAHNKRMILEHKKQLKNFESALKKQQEEFAKIEKEGSKLSKAVKEMAETGYWNNFKVDGGKLWFTSANDVVINFEGRNYNLGRFSFAVQGTNVTCGPFSGNRFYASTYHPYISHGGICWGGHYAHVQTALQAGDLVKFSSILYGLLTYYGTDVAPRISLTSLFDHAISTSKAPAGLKAYTHPSARKPKKEA